MKEERIDESARLLTPKELAALVKMFRTVRQWSQEQTGELAGFNVRTLQRVERGEPSDLDTRRAIARALDMQDIDALNKPIHIPSEAALQTH
jgi:transcriptional regulator with XRE-family HTH domain